MIQRNVTPGTSAREMLEDIRRLVELESPSSDLSAVARSAAAVAEIGSRLLGSPPEVIVVDGCTHLRWTIGAGKNRVLLLGHHDTVWPVGSIKERPWSVVEGVLHGPGTFDMKVGLVMALHAASQLPRTTPVTILITGDEEVGSTTSRDLIEEASAECVAALVLEASAEGGALKTARKGMSDYQVEVRGRAAHAGLEPENGVNAAVEIAHQIIAISELGSQELGTSVTPTVVGAGTTTNTVPARATLSVDVRAWSLAEQQRVDRAMHELLPVLKGAFINVTGGPNRPPLEPESSSELFDIASEVAEGLGLSRPTQAQVGGASDGNLTAGAGTRTLDGLGAVGGGAHADHEHAVVEEIPRRTALLVGLIDRLTRSVASDEQRDPNS